MRACKTILIFIMFCGVSGCATNKSTSTLNDYLDPATGITFTSLQEPAIFYHESPRLAANARDYLYVGPAEMNRMGKISYHLWLAAWSTIDRLPGKGASHPLVDPPEKIIVFLDGVPMLLQDSDYSANRYGTPQAPYHVPVKIVNSLYMRVSGDQLRKIAMADDVRIDIARGNTVRTYRLWQGTTRSFGQITQDIADTEDQRLVKD